jgi:predicted ATP-dependent serine protease
VGQMDNRLKEASKLGFKSALVPGLAGKKPLNPGNLRLTQAMQLKDILPLFSEEN